MVPDADPLGHPPGAARPVAAVVVDSGLAHLDRLFEYAVPADLDAAAQPGVRVRVRFAGRDLEGFVVARRERPTHSGALTPLRRVVSAEPVLTSEILALARATARRYAGVLGDVLRLAVPKRHAGAQRALATTAPVLPAPPTPDPGPWTLYPAGASFLRRVAAGQSPAAAWMALPGRPPQQDWPVALAVAAGTALSRGHGSLLVVPDHRDVERVDAELTRLLGRGRHVRLTADQGPQARYTAWLKVLRGHVQVVVGTRAAMFAPVRDLGLVAWWDDGDDLLREPRAPYPHVREVLAIRAELTAAAVLAAGYVRSVEVTDLIAQGRLADVRAPTRTARAAAPRVIVAGEGDAPRRDGPAALGHVPPAAWRAAKAGLRQGPVLVQVPRAGYLPALSCRHCREALRCPRCGGAVGMPGAGRPLQCAGCAARYGAGELACASCGSHDRRSVVVGIGRTAEELGRAFPGTPVLVSQAGTMVARVDGDRALVIATPGAEPTAAGGYAAALLLDAWATLDRTALDASVEALRRWCAAAALVRPGAAVVLAGIEAHAGIEPVEALVRWQPAWLAERELVARRALGLPPTVSMAIVSGPRRAVAQVIETVSGQVGVDVLDPVPFPAGGEQDPQRVHVALRVPSEHRSALTGALIAARATRSARKDPDPVSVHMDDGGVGL